MKKTLLVLSALLIFTSSSQSKEIEGEMTCKVKSNYVVLINEGKPEFYDGIKGSFAKDDDLILKFYTDNIPGFAQIKLLDKDKTLGSLQISQSKYSNSKIKVKDNGFTYDSMFSNIGFYSDYIIFQFHTHEQFRIERYYKSDWSGIISGWFFPEGGMGERIATLDCRQSSDKVDDFIQYIKGMVENDQ